MASIRDIAQKVGCSISTVSRYLNQSGYVSEEIGKKIAEAVAEFDYVPSQLARDLSQGHTRKIGVVVPHVRHTYFTELIQGLLDAALESQYQLLFLPSAYQLDVEQGYLEQLRAKAFDALILTSRAIEIDVIASYRRYGTIVCMEETEHPDIISVTVDRRSGYRELFSWLHKQGPQKVALLFSRNSPVSPTFRETMTAFKQECQQVDYLTLGGAMRYQDSKYFFKELGKQSDIDCIVSNNDDLAVGLLHAYQEAGLVPPLIVSQTSQLSGKILQIPSIDNHSYQLGKLAFDTAVSHHPVSISLPSNFLLER